MLGYKFIMQCPRHRNFVTEMIRFLEKSQWFGIRRKDSASGKSNERRDGKRIFHKSNKVIDHCLTVMIGELCFSCIFQAVSFTPAKSSWTCHTSNHFSEEQAFGWEVCICTITSCNLFKTFVTVANVWQKRCAYLPTECSFLRKYGWAICLWRPSEVFNNSMNSFDPLISYYPYPFQPSLLLSKASIF